MKLERLISLLDEEWRTDADFDEYLVQILRIDPKVETLTVVTTRGGLDAFGVLEHAGGRVRKRPGFVVPDRMDRAGFEEAENRRLRDAQAREREYFEALDRDRAAQRNPVWEAERQVIRGVIDERLRELGLLDSDTPAVSAGRE